MLSGAAANGRPRVRLRNPWPYTSCVTVALYGWPMTRDWFERGAMVAGRTLVLRSGERRTVTLRLTRAGRRFIAAGRRRVALVASEYEPEDTGMVIWLR